jgi:hypothetical protein
MVGAVQIIVVAKLMLKLVIEVDRLRGCLDPFKISNFYALSPSHQSLDVCMEHLM